MKIRTLTVEKARELDRRAQDDIGIPALVLMENAGIGLAHHIRQFMIPPINRCQVVMICGTGNNGGDAFVAARHLKQKSVVDPQIFIVGEESRIKEEAAVNYRIIKNLNIRCEPAARFEARKKDWNKLPVLIVDAIIGTGFSGPLRDPVKDMIKQINHFKKNHNCSVRVLAVDVPSGFNGESGANEESVKADMTVALGCLKSGMTNPEARAYVGRTEVVDIGIPEKLFEEVS